MSDAYITNISVNIACIGVLKTTPGFDDLLGLTCPRKAVILTVTVCHSKSIGIKISKGKKVHWVESRSTGPVPSFQLSF